ncbi:MAG: glycosyltransferase [Chitinivibrionales bacterium]|nr:glycosyltransferase [Chitinivibrionales bacterium]
MNLQSFTILTENFPPCAGGGIAEWALGIAEELARGGHYVIVLTRWKHRHRPETLYARSAFAVKKMHGHDWRRFRYIYSFIHQFIRLTRHPNTTIVATTWQLARPFAFLHVFFTNAKLIVAAHGVEITRINERQPVSGFKKTIAASTLTIAVSNFTRTAILHRCSQNDHRKVVFIPNAVDTKRFHRVDDTELLRSKLGIPHASPVILTLARVIERKGHDTVIGCLPQLKKHFPDLRYIIAGPWRTEYKQLLDELVDSLNLSDSVVFTGFVDQCDLNRYYSMASVYVMVSTYIRQRGDSEGFGITFLEANACECPVIGSRSGGIPDAIEDGVTGYLIEPEDGGGLRRKLSWLLSHPRKARQLGVQGRKRIETGYNYASITRRMLDEYRRRLNGNQRPH